MSDVSTAVDFYANSILRAAKSNEAVKSIRSDFTLVRESEET
jgi:hypothetical protein